MLQDVSFIDLNAEVGVLANILVREFVMPSPANQGDAVHVAACCIHGIEVILSWNVRHLANLNKMVHLRRVCERLGLEAPIIVTPEMDPE